MRDEPLHQQERPTSVLALLQNRHLCFTILAQFFYVGAQVGTGATSSNTFRTTPGNQKRWRVTSLREPSPCLALEVCFGIPHEAHPACNPDGKLLLCEYRSCLVGRLSSGWMGVWMIFTTSFFMSLMYPTIFALGLQGLGSDSKVEDRSLSWPSLAGDTYATHGIISDSTEASHWHTVFL